MATQPTEAIEVFFSYSHGDENLKSELIKHLANLKRQGVITGWNDREIIAGEVWASELDKHLNSARVILLLISPDFMSSNYCNDIEVRRAMERHEAGEARVIPVILRPVDWEGAPFSKLQAVPTGLKPITLWQDRDEAFLTVVKEIRRALKELSTAQANAAPLHTIPRPPIVGFVARQDRDGHDIVERLRDELAPHKNQLMALCGAGGVGKTTLAAESVRELREKFAHRVVWVSADGRPDFALSTLLDEIAGQLRHPEVRPLPPEQKEEQLRALVAVAPTLIVLDNFETIAETEQSRCADWLANRAACSAVITSRDDVPYARPVNIAAMSMPEAREFVRRLIGQARHPQSFDGLEHEQIIEAADRNPLVLQWIIKQIDQARQPRTVLNELSQGKGDAAKRVFGRSFDLLDDDGRAALLALSLFVPSASRSALSQVAGFGEDAARLDAAAAQLVELWLANPTEMNERLTVEGLTRELAKNLLSADARAAEFRQRFVAYFQNYAEEHAQPTPEDYDALDAERNNLLAAMDAAFEAEHWKSVMRIRAALEEFLDVRGHWDESIQRGEQAVAAAYADKDEIAVAGFAMNVATIRHKRGELDEAKQAYSKGVDAFRKLKNETNVAAGLHLLAMLEQGQGKLDEARRLYNESLEINKRLGDQSGIAGTLHQLAMLAQAQGELDKARRLYSESLEIKTRLGDQNGIASTMHELGRLAQAQGELEEARRLYDESLEIKMRLGNQSGIAITLHQLGRLAQVQGELEEAQRLYDESLEIKTRLGDQGGIAITLHQLAMLAQDQSELDEARRLYNESLEISKRLGNQSGIASTLAQLGKLAGQEGDRTEGVRLLQEAVSIFEKLKSPYAEIARRMLAEVENGESS